MSAHLLAAMLHESMLGDSKRHINSWHLTDLAPPTCYAKTHLFSRARKKRIFLFFLWGNRVQNRPQNPAPAGCLFSTRKSGLEIPERGDFGEENCLGKGGVDRAKKGKKDAQKKLGKCHILSKISAKTVTRIRTILSSQIYPFSWFCSNIFPSEKAQGVLFSPLKNAKCRHQIGLKANFFNVYFLALTQNAPFAAPRKFDMCLISLSWERTQ